MFKKRNISILTIGIILFCFSISSCRGDESLEKEIKKPCFNIAIFISDDQRDISLASVAEEFFQLSSPGEDKANMQPFIVRVDLFQDEGDIREIVAGLRKNDINVGIALMKGPILSRLCKSAQKEKIPLIAGWSERIKFIVENDRRASFLFGLDLHESFRPHAIALWADREQEDNWTVFIDKLDERSSTLGNLSNVLMSERGLNNRCLQFTRNRQGPFLNPLKDCVKSRSKNLLSWLAPSDSLRLQESLYILGYPEESLIYGGEAQNMLLGVKGLSVFSQDPFPSRDTVKISPEIFSCASSNAVTPSEVIKIKAMVSWLSRSLKTIEDCNFTTEDIISSLESIRTISFPGYFIDLSKKRHRPSRKSIFILSSCSGKWVKRDSFVIEHFSNGEYSILH